MEKEDMPNKKEERWDKSSKEPAPEMKRNRKIGINKVRPARIIRCNPVDQRKIFKFQNLLKLENLQFPESFKFQLQALCIRKSLYIEYVPQWEIDLQHINLRHKRM